MKRIFGFLLVAIVGLSSCESDSKEKCAFIPNVKSGSVSVQIESLEAALPAIKSKQDLVEFFSAHPQLRDEFFSRAGYPNDSAFINILFDRFTSPHIDTLLMETQKVFGDLSELKEEFDLAFANIQFYYPNFQPPKIQTVISGLETDLLVSDTLIVVGLDYFLGAGARYKPNMYGYMQRRYFKNFIVPSVLLLYGIDERFNKTQLTDKTVLADMIAYGKAYYFAKHMLPCVPDSIFIGYTNEELQGAKDNEDLVYIRLIENEVLYSTSYQIKQKYIAERPKTLEVGEKCPGRIGTWVGWRIMDSYAERHPETTLAEIMNLPDAEKIFKESKYRPEKK
jgi:hypothetical protein